MEQLIDQIVTGVIGILGILVAAALAELRVRTIAWIDARKNVAQRELLHKVAEEGFAFVEQTMAKSASSDKIQFACNYVSGKLKERKIDVEPDEIRAAVEKFVTEYNKYKKPA